jgi:hypothetical protein
MIAKEYEATLGRVINQQFQIQNVVQDTKVLKCLRSRGFVSICGISVMLYLGSAEKVHKTNLDATGREKW